ncbi:MAG: 50S ribosomal protein L31e [Candidatus Aenigmatarchaeota archaeon]
MEERIYTIPLKKDTRPRRYKAKRAINDIRDFAVRHMGDQDSTRTNVKIDPEVADKIWEHGVAKPPAKIRVRIKNDSGKITVETLEKEKKEIGKLLGETKKTKGFPAQESADSREPKEAPIVDKAEKPKAPNAEAKPEQKPKAEPAKPNLGSAK